MTYRYAVERTDYTDLASGSVLHSAPGFPAFPVRLATEVFQRGWHMLGQKSRLHLWDPCCGSGYLLTVLALLHRDRIASVVASDVDDCAVELARQNLALLTTQGLRRRAADLLANAERLQRPSYRVAAESVRRLEKRLAAGGGDVPSVAATADVFDVNGVRSVVAGLPPPQLLITDVPYGEQTAWRGPNRTGGSQGLLRSVAGSLTPEAVIALVARGRRVEIGGVQPAQRFKVGTRAVALIWARDVPAH